MSKRQAIAIGISMGLILIVGLIKTIAHADISNPHPTPPSNSVTQTMLTAASVGTNQIDNSQAFTFASSTHGKLLAGSLTATSSTNLTQTVTYGTVPHTYPSSQCANNQVEVNNGSGVLSCSNILAAHTGSSLTAGEQIQQGDLVAFGDNSTTGYNTNAQGGQTTHVGSIITSTVYEAVSSTTPASNIDSVTNFQPCFRDNSPTENASITVSIQTDNSGAPSGFSLGTSSLTFSNANGGSGQTFTFTPSVAVNTNTKYWYVMSNPTNTGQPELCTATGVLQQRQESSNAGVSWGGITNDSGFTVTYIQANPSKIYRASSAASNFRFKDLIGFAEAAIPSGSSGYIDTSGIATSPTSTTMGVSYFANDGNGTIGTSAGSNSRKVGTGLGANGFLINIALQ